MSEKNTTADAITAAKKSQQWHVAFPSPVCKIALQAVQEAFGLKNAGEAMEAVLGALLGHLPAPLDGETPEANGGRVGDLLAKLASMKSTVQALEDEREERALKAKQAKRAAEDAADARRLAEIKARKATA